MKWISEHLVGVNLFFVAWDLGVLALVLATAPDPYRLPIAIVVAAAAGSQVTLALINGWD